ncbi:MAG: hypothetical protein KJO84_08565 [Acidimicrobiia bacterium]|nr:hypothetical protein [Acidimicrobiia bacterium]
MKSEGRRKSISPLKVITAIVAIAAIVKELRTPKAERTWHGTLGDVVPYDFRMPTMDRIKATMWDPDGKVIVGRPFGVGWTLNLGAVVARIKAAKGDAGTEAPAPVG